MKSCCLFSLGIFFHGNNLIVSHGGENGDRETLSVRESSLDLTGKVIRVIRKSNIFTDRPVLVHERAESVGTNVDKGELLAGHVGNVGSVGRGDDIFVLLAGEDVNGSEVALGVSVLASLRGGDGRNLSNKLIIFDLIEIE